VEELTEVETGTGSNALDKRPQLKQALEQCRKHKATLLIAKLDRLARNVHFITGRIESRTDFVAADMPNAIKVSGVRGRGARGARPAAARIFDFNSACRGLSCAGGAGECTGFRSGKEGALTGPAWLTGAF
jgi:hypothetical protein